MPVSWQWSGHSSPDHFIGVGRGTSAQCRRAVVDRGHDRRRVARRIPRKALFHVGPSSADLRDCEAVRLGTRKGIYESVHHAPLKDVAGPFRVTLRDFDQ